MFKKYRAKTVVSAIILVLSILYTLPSTPLWTSMFGSLSEDYQAAVPQTAFVYETANDITSLTIKLNTSAPVFGRTNAPNKEDVLYDVSNKIRQALIAKNFATKTANTVTSLTDGYYVVFNVEKASKEAIQNVIKESKLYATMPTFIASIFPDKTITLGLDLRGGIDLVYQVDTKSIQNGENQDTVADAVRRSVEIIRNRIDMYGIAEPSIRQQNDNRIRIQIPGVKNPEEVKQLIQSTAMLQFHIVKESKTTADFLGFDSENEIIVMQSANKSSVPVWYRLDKVPSVTGADLAFAQVNFDDMGKPIVNLRFNSEGAMKFANVTGQNIHRQLAIVLDNKVHSAPVINDRITGGYAQITGHFTFEEAQNLAIVLRAGALPATLTALESRVVGPTLGQKSIKAGMIAGLIGFVFVIGYMLIAYRSFGMYADIALIFNSLIVFALLVYFGGTMTLPGIAGFILAVGMAVDANVIIFERIREEYKAGKTVRASIAAGFDRAFSCVLDSNITTLVVVAILYNFSTGPIRGFATTLGIGLVANLYTAVVVTKLLLDLKYGDGKTQKIRF